MTGAFGDTEAKEAGVRHGTDLCWKWRVAWKTGPSPSAWSRGCWEGEETGSKGRKGPGQGQRAPWWARLSPVLNQALLQDPWTSCEDEVVGPEGLVLPCLSRTLGGWPDPGTGLRGPE